MTTQGSRNSKSNERAFVPGDVIAARYRVVALLGRGGMGEVWRVDDLQLGQEVALKFLPDAMVHDQAARQRFLDEVRVARQVSHPNVCRVHDVGGSEEAPFLTMEYVDGEDLASLLRRIGRLPEDKAVELARQICAGLAAAHDRGIVHRDLKPANVLIDSEGVARIADFGLSAFSHDLEEDDARVGTPRYMAPEQLRGASVTQRSDVFSLGLVLFELFTGREAFRARTLDELVRAHESTRPDARAIVTQLDPAIDALLRRCLAPDPSRRPASARDVAAALPGGDPLAAAIAAGETPSPELIAASGGSGALRHRHALLLLGAVVALMAYFGWVSERQKLVSLVDPELPPAVLDRRALEIARAVGLLALDEHPVDQIGRFTERSRPDLRRARSAAMDEEDASPWSNLAHPLSESLRYWWRGSTRPLAAIRPGGYVAWNDPPPIVAGDVRMILAHDGRLLALNAVPSAREASPTAASRAMDWRPLLAAAQLDESSLEPAEADFLVAHDNNSKRALVGPAPGLEHGRLRVEMAALGAFPVHFDVHVDWGIEAPERAQPAGIRSRAFRISEELLGLLAIVGGAWFAVQNLRQGRGDLRGGVRVALLVVALSALDWGFRGHHAAGLVADALRAAPQWLFRGSTAGFLYVALEPTVRRTSPQALVTWQRLLSGRLQDAGVARDVLIGLVAGLTIQGLMSTNWLVSDATDATGANPHFCSEATFNSVGYHIGALANGVFAGSTFALLLPFLYVLALKVVRRPSLAAVVLVLIGLARMPYSVLSENGWTDLGFRVVQMGLIVALFMRVGLVGLLACFTTLHVVPDVVGGLDFTKWYLSGWKVVLTLVLLLATWAAWRASSPDRGRAPS